MIAELIFVEPPVHPSVQRVAHVAELGRVVSFKLRPGEAVPETRARPLLMVAVTDLELVIAAPATDPQRIALQAGDAYVLPSGVNGVTNRGVAEARFTLIDLRR